MILTDNDLKSIIEKTDAFSTPLLLTSLAETSRAIEDPSESILDNVRAIVTEVGVAVQDHNKSGKDPVENITNIWIHTANILISFIGSQWEPQSGVVGLVRTIHSTTDLQPVGSAYNPMEVELGEFLILESNLRNAFEVGDVIMASEDILYKCHEVSAVRGHDLITHIAQKLIHLRKTNA